MREWLWMTVRAALRDRAIGIGRVYTVTRVSRHCVSFEERHELRVCVP